LIAIATLRATMQQLCGGTKHHAATSQSKSMEYVHYTNRERVSKYAKFQCKVKEPEETCDRKIVVGKDEDKVKFNVRLNNDHCVVVFVVSMWNHFVESI
jgi:hypothetical protein